MDLAMGMRGCLVKDINTDNDTVKLCEKVEPGLEHWQSWTDRRTKTYDVSYILPNQNISILLKHEAQS